MGHKRLQADNRADTRGGGFCGIPHVVVDSAAYRDLSLWARAVLVEIVRQFNGYNNGKIAISQRQLAERLNTTNYRAIGSAIASLMEHGLIDVATEGQWKQRQAREYRLTFVTSGDRNHLRAATNDYRDWSPRKSSDDAASAGKGQSADTASAGHRKLDDTASARIAESRRKTANSQKCSADTASPLISKPYPSRKAGDGEGDYTPFLPPVSAAASNGAQPVTPEALAIARRLGAIR